MQVAAIVALEGGRNHEAKMQRRVFLHHWLAFAGGAVVSSSGCGTLLHQERIHAPHSRDIDWKIAALNGLGLALFFVPGVVAFVVDFYSGAIYLPPRGSAGYPIAEDSDVEPGLAPQDGAPQIGWLRSTVPPEELQPERIDQLVSDHVRRPVSLFDSQTRVSELPQWNRLGSQLHRHLSDLRFGMSPRAFFSKQRSS